MADPFATYADVEARWRTLSDAERAAADVLAADASGMIRDRWSDVDARIANGALSSESVTRVVAFMVKRAMINADSEGLESRSQTAGPFSVSDKYANPTGNLFFSAADLLVFEPEGYAPTARMGWLA